MRKILFGTLTIVGCSVYFHTELFGIHTILRTATNITTGELDSARLSNSSITKLGPTIEIGEITGGAETFLQNDFSVIFSSHINAGARSIHTSTTTLSSSTSTLQTRVNSIATDTGTLTSRVNSIATDTGTLILLGNNTNYIRDIPEVLKSSHTTSGISGGLLANNLQVIFGSHTKTGQFLRNDVGVIGSTHIIDGTIGTADLDNLAVTTAKLGNDSVTSAKISDGVILKADIADGLFIDNNVAGIIFSSALAGNLTSISSFSVTGTSITFNSQTSTGTLVFQSSAPMTNGIWRVQNGVTFVGGDLDTTGGGGGGGGISISSAGKPFQIVVGTVGSLGTDIQSANEGGINTAIAPFEAGIAQDTGTPATVFLKQGTYTWTNLTIPRGITVQGLEGSSTVITAGSLTVPAVTVFGKIKNLIFNVPGAYSDTLIVVRDSGVVDNVRIMNGQRADGNAGTTQIYLYGAVDCYVDAVIDDFEGAAQDDRWGGVLSSTETLSGNVRLRIEGKGEGGTGTQVFGITATGAFRTNFYAPGAAVTAGTATVLNINLDWQHAGGRRGMFITGGATNLHISGKIDIDQNITNATGILMFEAQTAFRNSTGNVVSNLDVIVRENVAQPANGGVIFVNNSTSITEGLIVQNCTVKQIGLHEGSDIIFVDVDDTQIFGTVLKGNSVFGMSLIQEGGTGSKYQSLGNFIENIEQ